MLTMRSPLTGKAERKVFILCAKLLVTGACFWYLSRQIDLRQMFSAVALLDFRWAALAILIVALQIPLVGLRWHKIIVALAAGEARITRAVIIAITAIAMFFAQVLPSVAGDGVRAWLLGRLGCDWRHAVVSVVIDRGIGAGLLLVLAIPILLLPAGIIALGKNRDIVLVVYCGLLFVGVAALMFSPRLSQWRYSRWLAGLISDARHVLIGPKGPLIVSIGCLIHVLTIAIIWSLARAQGLMLPLPDVAVLFTVMLGAALVPISVGGWGPRELAVVSLLAQSGLAPEQALLFSVSFGFALAAGSLPGGLVWLFYSGAPLSRLPSAADDGVSIKCAPPPYVL
jgi:uncharacterized membrane protein YbhN (UPF0104 family)